MASGVSQNGWPRNGPFKTFSVPRTNGKRKFLLHVDAGPLLVFYAALWHITVESLLNRVYDDWAFARSGPIGNSGVYSNHESGSAIDLNATMHPMGPNTLNSAKRSKIRSNLKRFGGALRWGGDYRSTLDQMHTELNVSRGSARARRVKMGLDSTGRPICRPTAYPLHKGHYYGKQKKHPALANAKKCHNGEATFTDMNNVRKIQACLVILGLLNKKYVTGHFNLQTHDAVVRFQKHLGSKNPNGLVGGGADNKGGTWRALQQAAHKKYWR